MIFSVSTALMAFAATVSAYTKPVGEPTGNPIHTPSLNEVVPVGKPFNITWEATTQGTVTLVLLRGPSTNVKPLYPIVEQIPNHGSYLWTPKTDLEADVTHYGLQLIVDATGQYQYSTQFGISNPDSHSSVSASESASATHSAGSSTTHPTTASSTATELPPAGNPYGNSTETSKPPTSVPVTPATVSSTTMKTSVVPPVSSTYAVPPPATTTKATPPTVPSTSPTKSVTPLPSASGNAAAGMKASVGLALGMAGLMVVLA